VKSELSIDEQLAAFLDEWEVKRAALVRKHSLAANRYRGIPHMRVCYEAARRGQEHYQHQLDMIQELRRRTMAPRQSHVKGKGK
jgi:hypothetical protein